MPAITEDTVRQLATFDGRGAPVTSCYLDVDGRRMPRHQDVELELEAVMRPARQRVNGAASVRDDLERIERYVRSGLDRSATRGLAFFSCSAGDLWEVVNLPVRVRSRVVINEVAAVGQLESVVQAYDRTGVLLVDRQRARMFVFDLGELIEHTVGDEDLPRQVDSRGERERGDPSGHDEAHAHQHMRHAADLAFATWHDHGYERLVIGASDGVDAALRQVLHPYLSERLVGRVPVRPSASFDEVRARTLEVEADAERAREADLVATLLEMAGSGGRGVTGLGPTLGALADHRVASLVVSGDFTDGGWRCGGCGALATVGPSCGRCGAAMSRLVDVVEEAIEVALATGCRVDVCEESADLDVAGRIGALLRY